ncbi:hypothetical protein Tco_1241977, partial [Tanacetum coccineum]
SSSLIPEKSDHQKVVEYENERVLAAKRKAQAAKDRAVEKRAATKGASHRPKKKKTTPFTIIPNKAELTTEGDGLILESVNLVEEDTNHNLHNVEDTTKVNSPFSEHSPRSQHSNPSDEYTHDVRNEPTHTHAFGSTGHGVNSSSGGSHCQALSRRNPVATALVDQDTESAGGHCLNRNKLSDDHKALQQVHMGFVDKEADLNDKLAAVEKEMDDLLDKNRERRAELEADIASKTSSLTEVEGVVSTLKGDLECLTVHLSHAEIVRHNYVRQLLPTVFQRLMSSDEYRKSLSG